MNKRNRRIRAPLSGESRWLYGITFRRARVSMIVWVSALAILGLTSSALVMTGVVAAPVRSSPAEQEADTGLADSNHTVDSDSLVDSSGTGRSTAAPIARDADSRHTESADPGTPDGDPDVPPERQSSFGAALQTIREQLQRQERPLGSRGSQCPYSPGLVGSNDTIWSNRPVFLWRSTGQTLSLYDYETDELIWQRQVEAGTEAVVYDGEPLQPGALYRWVLMHPQTSDFNATFMVMETGEREALAAELEQEQERWTAAGLTAAEQALERTMFFSDRRLWSDALQELHAVRESAEVEDTIHEISVYLCGTLESDIQAVDNHEQSYLSFKKSE